jgi:uncharacterized repeat protein (TIGR03847 family)
MAELLYDLHPVTHFTIDALGAPGRRTFLLQAADEERVVTLVIEKEQALALAGAIQELLIHVAEQYPERAIPQEPPALDLSLREPLDPSFRAGELGLGYDEHEDMLVLIARAVAEEGREDEAPMVRFWLSRPRGRAACLHALAVVAAGRPLCPLCGEPMDPQGHWCPRGNGHGKRGIDA